MKYTTTLLIIALIIAGWPAAFAQRAAGSLGIGAQFGQPTGLSLKIYQPEGISTDILAAWDLDDFFFLNVYGLIERHISNSERFHYFVGPGAFVGLHDRETEEGDEFAAGISGNFDLNIILRSLEIYGQFTPRLQLIDETSGDLGGGIGIRFYL